MPGNNGKEYQEVPHQHAGLPPDLLSHTQKHTVLKVVGGKYLDCVHTLLWHLLIIPKNSLLKSVQVLSDTDSHGQYRHAKSRGSKRYLVGDNIP